MPSGAQSAPSQRATPSTSAPAAVASTPLAYVYLTWLKRSPIRTPGFWVTGLKVVDLRGRAPSMARMTLRLVWWILGPFNFLLDLLYISNDEHRQSLRDKLVGTYVVRKDARPAGSGTRTIGRMSFMGAMLMYPVVLPRQTETARGA